MPFKLVSSSFGIGGTGCHFSIVFVETLVYDLTSDEMIWAGQSSTVNPSQADKMIKELVDEAGKEMRKQGLIAPKK